MKKTVILKYIEFIEKLNELHKQTGIHIETFGDNFYDPYLSDGSGDKKQDRIYITFDIDTNRYVGRLNNPYDGDIVSE